MEQPEQHEEEEETCPTPEDFDVADRVMALSFGSIVAGTPEYVAQRTALAKFRAFTGGDRFAFLYRLREPRNAVERIQREVEEQGWDLNELGRRLEAHVKRPIDAEMLQAFCKESSRRLRDYSRFLTLVVDVATDQRQRVPVRQAEREINVLAKRLNRTSKLYREELQTTHRFLTRMRRSLEPARCGTFVGMNAHHMARRVTSHAVQGWRSVRVTARRSRTSAEYAYATTASALFYTTYIEPGLLPRPSELQIFLELERERAEEALEDAERERSNVPPSGGVVAPPEAASVAEVDRATDRPSSDLGARGKDRMAFEEARTHVERIVRTDGFIGRNQFAKRIGCSTYQVDCVIKSSTTLVEMMKKHKEQQAGRRRGRELAIDPRKLDQIATLNDPEAGSFDDENPVPEAKEETWEYYAREQAEEARGEERKARADELGRYRRTKAKD